MADKVSQFKRVKLQECATFQEGYVNPSQGVAEYFGNEVKWLRAVDLNDSFVWETSRRLSKLGYESAGKASLLFEPDTLAISKSGTIGRLGILKDYMCGNRAVINIKTDRTNFDTRFIFYSLLIRRREIESRAVGSVQPNLYCSALGDIEIEAPPLPEQKAIASILGALDDKIELNQRMNATLEAIARALFQSWFVDFDPVRAKLDGRPPTGLDPETAALFPATFQDSPLGHIPQGWEVKSLSDLTSVITKGTTPTKTDMNTASDACAQINYIRVNSIDGDGSILVGKLIKIPEIVHSGVLKRSIIRENDVLYTIAGTIGRVATAEEWVLPANTNQAVAIIRPKATIPTGFLVSTLRHEVFREELHANIVQAVQANLSLGMLSKARLVVPPEAMLGIIFEPISILLKKINANRNQSRTLATLRDSLLPKLLSGELCPGSGITKQMETV